MGEGVTISFAVNDFAAMCRALCSIGAIQQVL
jgi:hypothetical protein